MGCPGLADALCQTERPTRAAFTYLACFVSSFLNRIGMQRIPNAHAFAITSGPSGLSMRQKGPFAGLVLSAFRSSLRFAVLKHLDIAVYIVGQAAVPEPADRKSVV